MHVVTDRSENFKSNISTKSLRVHCNLTHSVATRQRRATQSNARRASRTNAAETTPANQKPTPRIPNTTRTHQRPKTESYAPTASRSHRNHHQRPTSTTPSKPTNPAKDHPGSYPSPPSAPDAYKQRPSTSRHHSVWSVCPVLSRISQYVRQPDKRVGTPRP